MFKIANVAGKPINPRRPLPVGTLGPNEWGLFDMNGNVREWCSDWFGDYAAEAVTDPQGPATGNARVVRGGCYHYRAEDGRSSTRFGLEDSHARNRGFRVVLEVVSSLETNRGPIPPEPDPVLPVKK